MGAASVVIALVGLGAALAMCTEGWGVLDATYWAVVTAATVGYGDLTIEEPLTRRLATGYILVAVSGLAVSLSKFGAIIMEIEADRAVRPPPSTPRALRRVRSMRLRKSAQAAAIPNRSHALRGAARRVPCTLHMP